MPIDGIDYFVNLIDMPCKIRGFVHENADGTFSVFLNSRLSHEQNLRSYLHEKRHIEHNDFYRSVDVATMEREAL